MAHTTPLPPGTPLNRGELGGQALTLSGPAFARQRFANPSAFLDTMEKGMEKSRSHFFGDYPKQAMWGYTLPTMIRPEDLQKGTPTYPVMETSFASGQPVRRDVPAEPGYGQEYGYADTLRSDPHHYPNIVGTKPSDFYDQVRQPQRSVSMPTGVVAKVESWSKPPAELPLEGGRQSLNCDLSIFGDRFHEPPPPKPKPTGTFDWAKSPQRRRVAEQRSASADADFSATFGGASWAGRSQQLKKRYSMPPVDAATINAIHKRTNARIGATFYHPEGSVDEKCGKAGWFGTWTPTAPGLGGLHAPNKPASSVW